ncbi:hypothetical protein B0H66DRAFT_180508 [Apodospora peruviana]|uniref:Uncharacterized protein n=1 Tax=Apodospora peruviana TaxID=516989 RepID=A0AAE0IAX5_9PEZI|nr:hypothetical protein B0H66DRAFT_180508 [Apodospora peruviana]
MFHYFFLALVGLLAFAVNFTTATNHYPPVPGQPVKKWQPTKYGLRSNMSISGFDRYCPWCWTEIKVTSSKDHPGPDNYCHVVVQQPIDANNTVMETIDMAITTYEFKHLLLWRQIPWNTSTNFAVNLKHPPGAVTGQVLAVSKASTMPPHFIYNLNTTSSLHLMPNGTDWQTLSNAWPDGRFLIHHAQFLCVPLM